jgi:hypothetical protein
MSKKNSSRSTWFPRNQSPSPSSSSYSFPSSSSSVDNIGELFKLKNFNGVQFGKTDELGMINSDSPEKTPFFEARNDVLRWIHLITLLVFGLLFSVYTGFAVHNDSSSFNPPTYKLNIYNYNSQFISINQPFNPQSDLLTSYSIWIPVVVYMSFSILIQLIIVAIGFSLLPFYSNPSSKQFNNYEDYFINPLLIGTNWVMWLDNGIAGSIVIWIVAQLAGVTNIILLVSLVTLHLALSMAGAFGHEWINSEYTFAPGFSTETKSNESQKQTNSDEVKINWWIFVFGIVLPFIIIWGTILLHFSFAANSAITQGSTLYWFIWASVITLVILFLILEIIIIIIFYGSILPKNINNEILMVKHNKNYEISKLILSALIKIVLLIFLFISIFVR